MCISPSPNNGFTIKDTILLTDLGHVTPRRTGTVVM